MFLAKGALLRSPWIMTIMDQRPGVGARGLTSPIESGFMRYVHPLRGAPNSLCPNHSAALRLHCAKDGASSGGKTEENSYVEEEAVDLAFRFKEAAEAKLKGEEYRGEPKPVAFGDHVPTAVIGTGMFGVGLGLLSLIRGENRNVAGGAMALGVAAAVVQWSLLIAGAFWRSC